MNSLRKFSNNLCKSIIKKCELHTTKVNLNNIYAPLSLLTEDELMMKETVSKFAKEEILPLVKKMDKEHKIDKELLKKLFDNGLMGLEVPSEYGGTGNNFLTTILSVEEIAKIDGSVAALVDIHNTLVNSFIKKIANNEQKSKYLPRLAQECAGSFCLTEPNAGSDAFSLKVRRHFLTSFNFFSENLFPMQS